MKDDELNELTMLLKTHTALSRLSNGEVSAALRTMEAKGYQIIPPGAAAAWPAGGAPSDLNDAARKVMSNA